MSSSAALPYTSGRDPAPNLSVLLEFLLSEDKGQFFYRGQTRLWPGPLLPPAFRRYQKTGTIYTRDSPEYSQALRKVGQQFVGLVPINFFHETLALFYPPHISISSTEMSLLERLSNDQYLARTLFQGPGAIEMMLTEFELALFRSYLPYWKQVIDHDHRVQIRDMVFMRPFGYLLGQGLAQQYGFSSEMLDITFDPLVAAFFATHDAPNFDTIVRAGTGVIYRFARSSETSLPLDLGTYNFYSCPAVLDLESLLARFRVSEETGELRSAIESFLVTSFREEKKWRRWEAFRVSPKVMAATRIVRQSAALLVPDEIYMEQQRDDKSSHKLRVLMAVEDCAMREATAVFYFRHGEESPACRHMTREYLWPNEEDAFFEMVGNALLSSVLLDTGQILPSRIDLLDPGYRT